MYVYTTKAIAPANSQITRAVYRRRSSGAKAAALDQPRARRAHLLVIDAKPVDELGERRFPPAGQCGNLPQTRADAGAPVEDRGRDRRRRFSAAHRVLEDEAAVGPAPVIVRLGR